MTIDLSPEDCQLAIYALEQLSRKHEQYARDYAVIGAHDHAGPAAAQAARYRRVATKLHEAAVRDAETLPMGTMPAHSFDANGGAL